MWPRAAIILNASDTAGVFTMTGLGYKTMTASHVSRTGIGSMAAYTLTFPTAHLSGTNFLVIAAPLASGSGTWTST